ncbi:CCA tRNA nucleotidyltransferase [Staphylococcus borealis]|uniref:CCA tRNA nucleotidyltransferase n=1 Tax=Staphylococcus borealis TaxID=2742203 RepID=UPI00374E49A6
MGTKLFTQAKPILEKIEHHGFEAYFVGGSVRDYLMDRPIHDIDITTSATPDEIESIFDKTIPIGKEHGTINVVYEGTNYEVTTFRAESDYVDHRRPNEVYFVRDLKEDLQRRDFTINAIAMDKDFKIYDYFDGQTALQQQIITTVGIPHERFDEDALRILRGVRFQSQLNFTISHHTFEAMRHHITDIEFLSIERIVVELKKLIQGQNVSESYTTLLTLKFFNYVPFFKDLDMKATRINTPISFELWLAILKTIEQSDTPLSSLKISNKEKAKINQYHKLLLEMPKISTKNQLQLFVYDYGANNILDIIDIIPLLKENNIKVASPLIFNYQSIKEINHQLPIKNRKALNINGGDILKVVSKKSGPWLKEVLRQIESEVVTHKVSNSKDELLKWVKENVKI